MLETMPRPPKYCTCPDRLHDTITVVTFAQENWVQLESTQHFPYCNKHPLTFFIFVLQRTWTMFKIL